MIILRSNVDTYRKQTAQPRGNRPDVSITGQRKIIHIDMDAFFASVEQRDFPELQGQPVAVGGSRERGVVAAASYEARAFGVRSAMPSVTAKRKCPGLIFVKPRFDVYKAVSVQIREIFGQCTPLIEPLSLDEAYLDVSQTAHGSLSATCIAEDIRAKIKRETNLTASAGVSYNKFLAKLASDHRKPDGLFVIPPSMGPRFVETLPVARFYGVGPATNGKMQRLGIETGLDLRSQTLPFLRQHFGKSGSYYYGIARGIDERPVQANRERKSIGAENTFAYDLHELEPMMQALKPLIAKVWQHCETTRLSARTLTVKIKYTDFRQITRSRSCNNGFTSAIDLEDVTIGLLRPVLPTPKGIRLLGVSLSSLMPQQTEPATPAQLSLCL